VPSADKLDEMDEQIKELKESVAQASAENKKLTESKDGVSYYS
jgi:hypothetical protein